MASIITNNLRVTLAEQFYNMLDLGANAYLPSSKQSYVYVSLGKQLPWDSGYDIIPAPTESTNDLNDLYRDALFIKRMTNAEASFVVPRIDWVSGITYTQYTDSDTMFGTNFYVMNKQYKVFKCLSNNNGTASTYEPEITLSSTSLEEPYFETEDGYKWKYLYTLNSLQRQKYLTKRWMPVTKNSFVSAAAINGSIDVIEVTNSGNNYVNGTAQPIINITGDGTGAVLKANVSDGKIQNVVVQNRGSNYTYATLTFSDISGGSGNGANANVIISPQNGHGFDPVYELGASTLMFNCDFSGNDTSFFAENDYRQIFIIKNPLAQTGLPAKDEKYTAYYRIKTSPGLGNFNEDEVVFQGIDYNSSTFSANVVHFDEISNNLYVNNVRGLPTENQYVKGLSTGSIRIVNSIQNPSIKLYSGKILYISNGNIVSRDTNQTDRIRFILSF